MHDLSRLFRQEVIDAQSRRLHGEVILNQSLSTKALTALIVVIIASATTWILIGHYARVETAKGILLPTGGYAKIYAPKPGVVTSLTVKDGDLVKAGQELAVIKIESPNPAGRYGTTEDLQSIANQTALAESQIDLAGRREQNEVARVTGLIDGTRKQVTNLRDQIALQEKLVASMTKMFEQVAPVVAKGFISSIEYERRRQNLLSAQEDLSRLRQQEVASLADITQAERQRRQAIFTGQNDQVNARTAVEGLQQQKTKVEGEGSYSIAAPVSGRVTTVQVGFGRTVEEAVPLMVIIPDRVALRADLFLPSRAIGFVKPGQEVRLLYDAFPYQRFGSFAARIDTVSHLAVSGPETGAPFEIKEPVYRVSAVLERQQLVAYGRPVPLQAGMTLTANIVLDRQSFVDWILDPLRSVSRRN